MLTAIDVSGYQPTDLTPLIAAYNPDIVIVKHYLPDEGWSSLIRSQDHTRLQSQSVRDNGKRLQAYVFVYAAHDPAYIVDNTYSFMQETGAEFLWVDFETYLGTYPPFAQAQEVMRQAVQKVGKNVGIYTARWFWSYYYSNDRRLSNFPLWNGQYGPTSWPFIAYGGWVEEHLRQWTDNLVDQNLVFIDPFQGGDMNDAQVAELRAIADIIDNPNDPEAGFDALFDRMAKAFAPLHQYGVRDTGSEWVRDNFKGLAERLRKIPDLT